KLEHVEFVELHNSGTAEVDLTGWSLTGGVEFQVPQGTVIAAGAYLVVGQNPAAIRAKFGATALGPWTGRLANDQEEVVLRDGTGAVQDRIDYQLGFPWPTVGEPPGYSIELIHPTLDNDLGGSWRASVAGGVTQGQTNVVIQAGSEWRFMKGLSEASDPTTAWRQAGFDDSQWDKGNLPIGYDGDPNFPFGIPLADMRGNYTSVFLRRTFSIGDLSQVGSLVIEAQYDDGFKVWINGTNVLNVNIASGEVAYNGSAGPARESAAYETFRVSNPTAFLKQGVNVIAVQLHNSSLSGSSDCYFDARVAAVSGPSGAGPTPGRINAAYAPNAPPQIREVDHSPKKPRSGQPVKITAKVTD
ncbi:MAG: lamin tail domain-containing protein, partial [Phycisphaerales bacterium]|nr:lamin tail domain-containing protein [Phycisphaerales bacterium]